MYSPNPILAFAFVAMLGCSAPPPAEVNIDVHRIVLFVARGIDIAAPELPQKHRFQAARIQFLEAASEIPAILGTRFGFLLTPTSKPPRPAAQLDVVPTPPALANPDTGETFATSGHTLVYPPH